MMSSRKGERVIRPLTLGFMHISVPTSVASSRGQVTTLMTPGGT